MLAGLAIAVLVTYRRKRTYEDLPVAGVDASEVEHGAGIQYRHWVTLVSLVITVAVQLWQQSLPLAALCGLIVMFAGKAVEFKDIDEQFTKGITMMGYIAFVMLIAGGYALILKETGAVTQLVEGIVPLLGENKILTAFMITLVGLVVTMGIGTSFGTIPIVAVIYVPLCQAMGFSTAATILLISAAGALGDAGSPASDSTLGPTSGLNADGQHSHIFDTCIPTFLHYNIPLMLAAIIGAQFL
jgi:predicted histidine transporter YuiF (NhaC family)